VAMLVVAFITQQCTIEHAPTVNVVQYCPCQFDPRSCNRSNLVFVHIPKTGGESIEATLGLLKSHDTADVRLQDFRNYSMPRQVLDLQDPTQFKVLDLPPDVGASPFVFSIIRNPYDRVLSWFRFCIHGWQGELSKPHEVCRPAVRLFRKVSFLSPKLALTEGEVQHIFWQWMQLMTAPDCLESEGSDYRASGRSGSCLEHNSFGPYSKYVFNQTSGRLVPDFIMRFEEYAADTSALLRCLGLDIQIRHENGSGNMTTQRAIVRHQDQTNSHAMADLEFLANMSAKSIYTAASQKWVATNYAADFRSFGYSFEL
jgi:hypothetical protein